MKDVRDRNIKVHLSDGSFLVVLKPGVRELSPSMVKEICGGPCAQEFAGEAWLVVPLKTK